MTRKAKAPDSLPSKAYLVSFGDTMTALLAFFIVLNSLAKEQTGANMHAGTGSFVAAFASSGTPGTISGNNSSDMIQQTAPTPVYGLAENLDKNETEGSVGPDDTYRKDRIIDREKDNFQKFLSEIESKFGLKTDPPIIDQIVFDSFEPFNRETGALSAHAIELASDIIPKLRDDSSKLEIVVWASIPSKTIVDKTLYKSMSVKVEIESKFWLKPMEIKRIRYSVKPWLFSDVKRPVLSFILSKSAAPATE